MIRNFFLAATIALESTLALIFTTSAQTIDPYINELLRQTNEFIQDSDRSLNEFVLYKRQQLSDNCITYEDGGDDNKYNQKKELQCHHMDAVQRQAE